ncbi:DUF4347 domain-containing protein [Rhodocyclus purpureus]|uniref:DUF4347 domain-containing protein n=1 Tax=Rhodocyclus purpureus TaxID=1067 RepID=UPI00191463D3|nr:DUF4347 domain-containing protein [Rhodocyclus purpureus]MBK5913069.1 hypothetical protein [Rhodocyclus purpureus]
MKNVNKSHKPHHPAARRLVRRGPNPMALEQRFMFDGAAVADAAHAADAPTDNPLADVPLTPAPAPDASAPEKAPAPGTTPSEALIEAQRLAEQVGVVRPVAGAREVLFIDSAVADKATLIAGTREGVEIVVLDAGRDAWVQMTEVIAQHQDLDAVHLVSHGSEGTLLLGGQAYDAAALQAQSASLDAWQSHLSENADILVYGCDVAAGADGQALISSIAKLTSADVAASTDSTGAAVLGGDWVLESQTGAIEARSLVFERYSETLASNSAPVLDTSFSPTLPSINEDIASADNTGTTVGAMVVDGSITDLNASTAPEAIYVTAVDNTHGTWQFKTGSRWTDFDFSSNLGKGLLLDSTNSIRFVPDADWSGTATLTFGAWDKSNANSKIKAGAYVSVANKGGTYAYSSTTDTASITVNSVNDAPVLGGAGWKLSFTEGDAAKAIDSSLTLTDVDDSNIESATVKISGAYLSSEDVLSFTDVDGITGSWNSGTGVLTLTGSATKAQYQSALESVKYQNTNNDNPSTSDRTVTWVVNDGTANSASVTSTISVNAVNDAPTLTATAVKPTFTEGGTSSQSVQGAAVAVFSGVKVSTVESGQSIEGITFTVSGLVDGANESIVVDGKTITLGSDSTGTTKTSGRGYSYTVKLSGTTATIVLSAGYLNTLSTIEAATLINGITYQNTNIDNPTAGERVFTLTVKESGTYCGEADTSLPITSTLTVAPVDDAPVVYLGGPAQPQVTTIAFNPTGYDVGDKVSITVDGVTYSYTVTKGNTSAEDVYDKLKEVSVSGVTLADKLAAKGVTWADNLTDNAVTLTSRPGLANAFTIETAVDNGADVGVPWIYTVDFDGWISGFSSGSASKITISINGTEYSCSYSGAYDSYWHSNGNFDSAASNLVSTLNEVQGVSASYDSYWNTFTIQTTFDATITATSTSSDTTGSVSTKQTGSLPSEQPNLTVTTTSLAADPIVNRTVTFTEIYGTDNRTAAVAFTSGDINISDVDSAKLANLKVSIDKTTLEAGDQLLLGTTAIDITGTAAKGEVLYNGTRFSYEINDAEIGDTRTVTFTSVDGEGESAPAFKASYENLLDNLKFNSTSDNFTKPTRIFDVTVNDGELNSEVAKLTVNMVAVNEAPVVDLDTTDGVRSGRHQETTISFNAAGYDVGDVVSIAVDGVVYSYTVAAGHTSAEEVYDALKEVKVNGVSLADSLPKQGVTPNGVAWAANLDDNYAVTLVGGDGEDKAFTIATAVDNGSDVGVPWVYRVAYSAPGDFDAGAVISITIDGVEYKAVGDKQSIGRYESDQDASRFERAKDSLRATLTAAGYTASWNGNYFDISTYPSATITGEIDPEECGENIVVAAVTTQTTGSLASDQPAPKVTTVVLPAVPIDRSVSFTEVEGPDDGTHAVAFTEGGINISDVDSENLANLKVSIDKTTLEEGDQLLLGTTVIDITGNTGQGEVTYKGTWFSYKIADDGNTRTITFTSLKETGGDSAAAPKASYESLLDALKFNSTSDYFTDQSTRIFNVTVNDGSLDSAAAVFTVTMNEVDDGLSVNDISVNEGSPYAVFKISAAGGSWLQLSLKDGTAINSANSPATDGAVDFGPTLQVFDGKNWVDYVPGSRVQVPAGGSLLMVRTPIINDTLYEGSQTFTLRADSYSTQTSGTRIASAKGTATIHDDGTGDVFNNSGEANPNAAKNDDRPLQVDSPTVNEGSDYVVFTVTGVPGRVDLSLAGTATDNTNIVSGGPAYIPATVKDSQNNDVQNLEFWSGTNWVRYDGNNASIVDAGGGTGKLLVRVNIASEHDTLREVAETFKLVAQQSADPSSGTATIRDDGTGSYWIGNNTAPATPAELAAAKISLDDDLDKDGITPNTETALADMLRSQGISTSGTAGDANGDGTPDAEQSGVATLAWTDVKSFTAGNDGTLTSVKPVITMVVTSGSTGGAAEQTAQLENIQVADYNDPTVFGETAPGTATTDENGIRTVKLGDGSTATTPWDPIRFAVTSQKDTLLEDVFNGKDGAPNIAGTQVRVVIDVSAAGLDAAMFTGYIKYVSQEAVDKGVKDLNGNTITKVGWYDFTAKLDANGNRVVNAAGNMDGARFIVDPATGKITAIELIITDNAFGDNNMAENFVYDPGVPVARIVEAPATVPPPILRPQAAPEAPRAPAPFEFQPSELWKPMDFLSPEASRYTDSILDLRDISDILTRPGDKAFRITVVKADDPSLYTFYGVSDQVFDVGSEVMFQLPSDTFAHTRENETVRLMAQLADGGALPKWLHFDPATGIFSGKPPVGTPRDLAIKVTALDTEGRKATTTFRIKLVPAENQRALGRAGLSEQIRAVGQRSVSMERLGKIERLERVQAVKRAA